MVELTPTPKSGDHKEMLTAFLNQNRDVLRWKTEGLSDEAGRTSPFHSDFNIIGVIQHLALVETSWFCELFDGQAIDYEREFGFDFDQDIDAEWHLNGTETTGSALALYDAAINNANAAISAANINDLSAQPSDGSHFTLGWALIHMIEETARHTGHVDIVREHLDQTTGYLPYLPTD